MSCDPIEPRFRRIGIFIPSLAGGGAERVFVGLANDFNKSGFKVDLLLASAVGPYLTEVANGVRIVNFKKSGVLLSLPSLIQYLRRDRPSVLLSGLDHANIVAVVAAVLARSQCRRVISVRAIPSVWYQQNRAIKSWLLVKFMRAMYRFSDAVIVNSKAVGNDVCKFLKVSQERVAVIYNPIDTDSVTKLSYANISPVTPLLDRPIVLGVGRLEKLKSFTTLVEAFAIVRAKKECALVILGDGPDREKLFRRINELGIEDDSFMPGFVANPFAWMRRANVLVSSSISEGCPNSVLQALVCGTPVISTIGIGGAAEVLENGKWGQLVPVGDSLAMSEAIERALNLSGRQTISPRAAFFSHREINRQYLRVLLPDNRQSVESVAI